MMESCKRSTNRSSTARFQVPPTFGVSALDGESEKTSCRIVPSQPSDEILKRLEVKNFELQDRNRALMFLGIGS